MRKNFILVFSFVVAAIILSGRDTKDPNIQSDANSAITQPQPNFNPVATQPQPNFNPAATQPQPSFNPATAQPRPNFNPATAQPRPNFNPATAQPRRSPVTNISAKININTANLAELQRINHIGPVIGQRIIEYRNNHGPFTNISQITRIKGIGKATFEKIKDFITI